MPTYVAPALGRPPTIAEVGQALRQARLDAGLRQVDVAERANVAPLTVWRVEKGRQDVAATLVLAMAVAVGVALFWRHLARIVGGAAIAP